MSLAKLKEKYDYRKPPEKIAQPDPEPEHTHELKSWQDSAAIVRLSEYLRANKQHGVRLGSYEGEPCIHFEPGLRGGKDMDIVRWQIAVNAVDLLIEALHDINDLKDKGIKCHINQ